MDEATLKKLETLTVKYSKGGAPTAYVNTAAQLVGQVKLMSVKSTKTLGDDQYTCNTEYPTVCASHCIPKL